MNDTTLRQLVAQIQGRVAAIDVTPLPDTHDRVVALQEQVTNLAAAVVVVDAKVSQLLQIANAVQQALINVQHQVSDPAS